MDCIRSGNSIWFFSDEASKLDERRQWLDNELEDILSKKQAMETLQEELAKREEILKEREQMVKEKSELQMKKLRSSQVLSKVRKFYIVFYLSMIAVCFIFEAFKRGEPMLNIK